MHLRWPASRFVSPRRGLLSRAHNWWGGLEEMGTTGRAPGGSEQGPAAFTSIQPPATQPPGAAQFCKRHWVWYLRCPLNFCAKTNFGPKTHGLATSEVCETRAGACREREVFYQPGLPAQLSSVWLVFLLRKRKRVHVL